MFLGFYDEESIKKLESFILSCFDLVHDPSVLWFAIQPNAMVDVVSGNDETLQSRLLHMKEMFNDKGFHLASLSSNMRCTKEISNVEIDRESGGSYQMKEYTSRLKSSVIGTLPILIPICTKDPKNGYGRTNWTNAMKGIVQGNESLPNTDNWVILHDMTIRSNQIKKQLKEAGMSKDIRTYSDDQDEPTNLEELKYFVENQNSVLIVESKLFTGCETANVIYLCNDSVGNEDSSLRCHLLRTVQNLVIIYLFNDDIDIKFKNICLDTKYLTCERKIYQNDFMYNCLDCNLSNICSSCQFSCHQEHIIEDVFVKDDIDCNCVSNLCKIQK